MSMIGNSLAQGLISGANIQDGTVDTPDLKDSAITAAKIADGVIAPGKLDFSTGTANGMLYLNGSKVASSGSAFIFDGTNVGIGTSSPSYPLDVAGAARSNSWIGRANGSAPTADCAVYRPADNSLGFSTANTERMRIDSSGNLLVGTTSASASSRLRVQGSGNTGATYTVRLDNSDGTLCFAVEGGGAVYTGTAGDSPYNATTASAANVFITSNGRLQRSTSSLKYKTNVQDAAHGLVELLTLRSVTYEGKSESDAGKTFGGLIAEEVHEAGLTEFVQYAEDGTPDALAYGPMVSLCIKAIQEQQAIITQLQARLAALEAK